MKINELIESYQHAVDDELNKTHIVKSYHENHYPQAHLYTDGSAKKGRRADHGLDYDGRGFGGWGYYMRSDDKEFNVYGNIFNTDAFESEIRAVLEAVKRLRMPLNLHLKTDSAYVVRGLADIEGKMQEKRDIESISPSDRKAYQWRELRNLKYWEQLYEEIKNSDKILSMDVKWVRSHNFESRSDIPNINEAKSDEEREFLLDCIGNFNADIQANEGAKKQIKAALFNLKLEKDENRVNQSIAICAKNFSCSNFSRSEAVRLLSGEGDDFLPRDVISSILGKEGLDRIIENRAKNNLVMQKPETSMSGSVLPSATPAAKERFSSKIAYKNRSRLTKITGNEP